MPEPVTVWMVQLASGNTADVEGLLRLDDDALVFEPTTTPAELRFRLATIERVRRVIGSPVLVIEWTEDAVRKRTAFYFSPPPPLEPPTPEELARRSDRPRGPLAERRALSKRRHMRSNLGTLAIGAKRTKPVVQAWATELRIRISDARA
ncbi:MAG TPA: hypothetical protein VLA82_13325 [Actinomycetota bacterium]|nr:hypothetical protein [Actinomycetota bacterium]